MRGGNISHTWRPDDEIPSCPTLFLFVDTRQKEEGGPRHQSRVDLGELSNTLVDGLLPIVFRKDIIFQIDSNSWIFLMYARRL